MTGIQLAVDTANEVLDGVAATSMQLDFLFDRIEKKEVQPQITLWMTEFSERFDTLVDAVFDPNDMEYKETIGMLNRSEEEIGKFRNDQSRIMKLTTFLIGLLNQVDALITGAMGSQKLRN